jgi:3-oxoacyl-[acyl-carrier protein] reductase
MDKLSKKLPLNRVGTVEEIGVFVKSIVENNIKYLNGVTINFDGGHSNFIF